MMKIDFARKSKEQNYRNNGMRNASLMYTIYN